MQQIFLDLFSNLFLFNLIINEIILFSIQIQLYFKVLNIFVLFKIMLIYAIYILFDVFYTQHIYSLATLTAVAYLKLFKIIIYIKFLFRYKINHI